MPDPIATYHCRVSGFWNTRHRIHGEDPAAEPLGILEVRRDLKGMVLEGHYRPTKGEVLHFRRDPGLLRSQFSLWTEGREWLGSSLRWSVFARGINVETGSRSLRLLPTDRPGFGWQLWAPKTGRSLRITSGPFARRAKIEVFRRTDFEIALFSYFLGFQVVLESFWPGPRLVEGPESVPAAPRTPAGA